MSLARSAAGVIALLIGAAPLAAQRTVVLNLNAGGYSHFTNLNASGAPTADFKPGYNLGASVGVELTQWVAVHGDFTFARTEARGTSSIAGNRFNRLFYGAHAELRYPTDIGLTPFAFAGAGAVTVNETNGGTLPTFTKPAGMLGLGFAVAVPGSRVEVFAEGKSLVYKWDRAGFNKTLWDVTYSVGLAYRLPVR